MVLNAAMRSLREGPFSPGASRVTTGEHAIYRKLEGELARRFKRRAACLASGGYVANLVAAQLLREHVTHGLIDNRAHVSLVDGLKAVGLPLGSFGHRDVTDLRRKLAALPGDSSPLVATDGLFGHDGAVAPLKEYLSILPANGWLLVDDAHGVGVLGKEGRGSVEHCGVDDPRIVLTGTLSKAFGAYGGFVLSERFSAGVAAGCSAAFAGGTPMPVSVASAALAGLRIAFDDRGRRKRLSHNIQWLKSRILKVCGERIPAAGTPGPMLTVVPVNRRAGQAFRRRLLQEGVFPSWIRYPGGPEAGMFRFALSSQHRASEVASLWAALKWYLETWV